jgi:hypothetical protein
MTLATVGQEDFAVGTLRGIAPDVQPGVGVYTAANAMLNDDGDLYRRGGTRYYSQALGSPLTWMWNGTIGSQDLILVATDSEIHSLQGDVPVFVDSPGLMRPVKPAVVGDKLYLPNFRAIAIPAGEPVGEPWTPPGSIGGGTAHVETIAGRLVVASGNRIAFSEPVAPGAAPVFVADDYHELPGGVSVSGLIALQDTLLVFTTYGMWTISNMAYNLTDVAGNIQQVLSQALPEVSLMDEAGLAVWSGRVIAPCVDRVYLLDAISAPVAISESIAPLYMDLVRRGARPGQARAYRNTLFLPLLLRDQNTLEYNVETVLVCRLNRPIAGRQVYYPWSELRGHAAKVRAFDVSNRGAYSFGPQLEAPPFLLGAGQDGRVIELSALFTPTAANARDADNTPIEFEIETRDFPTGQGQPNHVKRLRLNYTLEGAAQILAEITDDRTRTVWVALGSEDLTAPGQDPVAWWLHPPPRVRFARVRFKLTGDPARLVFHRVDLTVRPAAHAR